MLEAVHSASGGTHSYDRRLMLVSLGLGSASVVPMLSWCELDDWHASSPQCRCVRKLHSARTSGWVNPCCIGGR